MAKVVVIIGPTGSGKTDLAIRLARRFGGEIICADSRTVYRGMDIGTAKPTRAERRRVPHHLLDIRDPNESYSVAAFQRDAERWIRDIHRRGKLPIVVGGTGLYIAALTERLRIPPIPAHSLLRAGFERTSTTVLLRQLAQRDPVTFARIDQRNRRRIIRALEVCIASGQPFSVLRTKGEPQCTFLVLGIVRTRRSLTRRIDARIRAMFRAGLVAEVNRLVQRYGTNIESLRGIIYREVVEYLLSAVGGAIPTFHGRGKWGYSGQQRIPHAVPRELVQRVMFANHRYARRQLTWCKRDERIRWVRISSQAEALVRRWLASA